MSDGHLAPRARARIWPAAVAATMLSVLVACGGKSGGADTPQPQADPSMVPPVLAQGLNRFVGWTGGSGHADGTGVDASFRFPGGVAVDAAGNVYVADSDNGLIRKVTPAGVTTTLAGHSDRSGPADGVGTEAAFSGPQSLALDAAGNLYVVDGGAHQLRKITPDGVVSTLAGSGQPGAADGKGKDASFQYPQGVAVDAQGNVYVADTSNQKIRKVSPEGVVSTLAGTGQTGSKDGPALQATFFNPSGVAVNRAGEVFVADASSDTVWHSGVIRKIATNGQVSTVVAAEVTTPLDNEGMSPRLGMPIRVHVDAAGDLLVVDAGSNAVRKVTLSGPAPVVTTLVGGYAHPSGYQDGPLADARFQRMSDVAVDAQGQLFVADSNNHAIRRVTPQGVASTLAGQPDVWELVDGQGTAARFSSVSGVVRDKLGNLFVADSDFNVIRKVTPSGRVSVWVGDMNGTGLKDGPAGSAVFQGPEGLAMDSQGNIYVADADHNAIRKINPAGQVTTLAGTGAQGHDDGPGKQATFSSPQGLVLDAQGNLYVGDFYNNLIRKVSPDGAVSTVAGRAEVSGHQDGQGLTATFYQPKGLAMDAAGQLYIADSANHRIRKMTPGGLVSTVAGSGQPVFADGQGQAAGIAYPFQLVVDAQSNLYVSDGSGVIRKVSATGAVSTVVGSPGLAGFHEGALPGVLRWPGSLVLAGRTLYVAMDRSIVVVRDLP